MQARIRYTDYKTWGLQSLSFAVLIILFLTFSNAYATTVNALYVSPTGNNHNSGTLEAPFQSIQYGVDQLQPGQTLYIQSGVYRELLHINRSGTQTNPIAVKAAPGARPILDGLSTTGKPIPGDALIEIDGQSFVHIEGLELRNHTGKLFPIGILIANGSSNIEIRDNLIHNIDTNAVAGVGQDGGASAIMVIGDHPTQAIQQVLIEGNTIYDCELGVSEAISISKNVDGFTVKNNHIRNVSNIGIDVAGFYSPFKGSPELNQARNGQIIGNTVSRAQSKYHTGDASGIYIDGARNIAVTDNKIYENDNGLTIGCEIENRAASDILVKNNLIWNNEKSGLSIGGWHQNSGRVFNVIATDNLTYKNNLGGYPFHAELSLKLTEGKIEISDNIFYSRQTKDIDFANDKVIYPLLYNLRANPKLSMRRNLWYAELSAEDAYFRYNDVGYLGIQSLIAGTGLEPYGYFIKPAFADTAHGDFRNLPGSPSADFGPYASQKSYGPYLVDGKLNEWYPFTSTDALRSRTFNRFHAIKSASDGRSLWFGIIKDTEQAITQVYLDVDQSAKTGYRPYKIQNTGAEYLIEDQILYRYAGDGSNWLWEKVCPLNYVDKPQVREFQVPLSHLLIDRTQCINFAYSEKSSVTSQVEPPILGTVSIVMN